MCISLSPSRLISLSIIISRSICVVANDRIPFIFIFLQFRKFSFFLSCIFHRTQIQCAVKVHLNLCDCNYIKYFKTHTHTEASTMLIDLFITQHKTVCNTQHLDPLCQWDRTFISRKIVHSVAFTYKCVCKNFEVIIHELAGEQR